MVCWYCIAHVVVWVWVYQGIGCNIPVVCVSVYWFVGQFGGMTSPNQMFVCQGVEVAVNQMFMSQAARDWSHCLLVFSPACFWCLNDGDGSVEQLGESLSHVLLSCKAIFSAHNPLTAIIALYPNEGRNVNTITSAIWWLHGNNLLLSRYTCGEILPIITKWINVNTVYLGFIMNEHHGLIDQVLYWSINQFLCKDHTVG